MTCAQRRAKKGGGEPHFAWDKGGLRRRRSLPPPGHRPPSTRHIWGSLETCEVRDSHKGVIPYTKLLHYSCEKLNPSPGERTGLGMMTIYYNRKGGTEERRRRKRGKGWVLRKERGSLICRLP